MNPVLMRGALGLLAVFFAHFLGKVWGRATRRAIRSSRIFSWGLRTVLALAAIYWAGGPDAFWWAVLALAALSGGIGFYNEWKPQRGEDLSKTIFPGG